MMKVLVDADWILELFVNRDKYSQEAEKLLEILNKHSKIEVYGTDLGLEKIYSFISKHDPELGQDAVSKVRALLNNLILPFEDNIKNYARTLSINDYESAVEVAFAEYKNIGAIITLNPEKKFRWCQFTNFVGQSIHRSLVFRTNLESK